MEDTTFGFIFGSIIGSMLTAVICILICIAPNQQYSVRMDLQRPSGEKAEWATTVQAPNIDEAIGKATNLVHQQHDYALDTIISATAY